MKSIKYIAFAVVTCFALSNCGDTFSVVSEIDPPEFEDKMSVSSFISSEDTMVNVFVGRNKNIFNQGGVDDYGLDGTAISIVKEASGESLSLEQILGPQRTYNYTFSKVDMGFFEPGLNYTFTVDHPDYDKSVTTLAMPAQRKNLENIKVSENDVTTIEGDDSSRVTFDIVDPADTNDYYELEIAIKGRGINTNYTRFLETIDPVGVRAYPQDNLLISDATFNGQTKNLAVTFDKGLYNPKNDTLVIRWKSLNRGSYEYAKSLIRHLDTQNAPFLSPVQIHTNVNDAIGSINLSVESTYEIYN